MKDILIIAIILLAAVGGVSAAVRHFRGQGGCCGGGGYKPRRKKLKQVLYTKTFCVAGMHCDHCRVRVEEVINDMSGLAGRVDLKKGELIVSYAEPVEDAVIAARLARAGYPISGERSS